MYQIVQAPNEILRTKAKHVDFSGDKLKFMVSEMIETMLAQEDPEGIGLAANQAGLPWKIFVARFGTKKSDKIHSYINPEVLDHAEELWPDEKSKKTPLEGCLSKPNYYGAVKRWKWLTLRYQTLTGEIKEEKFEDFPAVVIQHEIDHLQGKLFIERIIEQQGKLYKITGKGHDGKENWEEVEF